MKKNALVLFVVLLTLAFGVFGRGARGLVTNQNDGLVGLGALGVDFAMIGVNPINNVDSTVMVTSCFNEDKCKEQAVGNYRMCLFDSKGSCALLVGRCVALYKSQQALAVCVALGSASCVLGPCGNDYWSDLRLCELTRPINGYSSDDYLVPDGASCN